MRKWKCTVCSYVYTADEKPEKCPACGADASMIVEVQEDGTQSEKIEKKIESAVSQEGTHIWKCVVCTTLLTADVQPKSCSVCGADSSLIVAMKDSAGEDEATVQEPEMKEEIESVAEKTLSQGGVRKWKCTICNYIHTGDDPPEKCPVCGADKSFFVEITSEQQEKADEDPVGDKTEDNTEQVTTPIPEAEQADFGIIGRLIVNHHLHPISVHTPNGVLPLAIVFLFGATFFGFTALDLAALFNLIGVLLSMPVVFGTGYIAWQLKYKGVSTYVFKIKFLCGLIVAVGLTLMICWRLIQQNVALEGSTYTYVYLGIGLITLAAAGIAGHLGGKLVFNK